MKKYKVGINHDGLEDVVEVDADSDDEALRKASDGIQLYGTICCTVLSKNERNVGDPHEKVTRKGGKRKFIATVFERFSDTFEVWAENEKEARQIVEDGIPDDYCPSATGGGYAREITIDPDFSD